MSYGPQLPNSFGKNEEENSKDLNVYGPTIPKNLLKNEENKAEDSTVFGPVIPISVKNDGKEVGENEESDEDNDEVCSYGPSIPKNFESLIQAGPSFPPPSQDSDEDIGPMPIPKGNEDREELERAYRLAMQKEAEEEEKNNVPKREEWMTSIPKSLGNFGLGARTFKKGTVSERDSTWEDAPGAKKKRKTDEKPSSAAAGIAAADARQAKIVDEKAAGPSLLDLHQKQRQEKVASKGYKPGERQPFDREKDMEVRGLKPGASKETVDRLKEFSSRFANSKEKRFL